MTKNNYKHLDVDCDMLHVIINSHRHFEVDYNM